MGANSIPILNQPWPPDLNAATVPFRTRSVTVLARRGYFGNPALFDTLTEAELQSWWTAGHRDANYFVRRVGSSRSTS